MKLNELSHLFSPGHKQVEILLGKYVDVEGTHMPQSCMGPGFLCVKLGVVNPKNQGHSEVLGVS